MRAGPVLALLGTFLLSPVSAQEATPVTASVEDIARVHLAFQTIELLGSRCALETSDAATYAAMTENWRERNGRVLRLADGILAFLGGEIDEAVLAPQAEAHAEDLFDSIMRPAEICALYLQQVEAGELDLRVVVPDLHSRILTSDGAIASMNQTN